MRHIYEYIIGKNTKVVKNSDFEKFETKEDICNFFDSKGFERFECDDYNKMIENFKKSYKPIYYIGEFDYFDEHWWIRFGKGGKDEYVFFWNIKDPPGINNYCVDDLQTDRITKIFESFKEFREYVINYFNW